jgi:hypothetical protein
MCRRQAFVVLAMSVSLMLGAGSQPAFATGMISTERAIQPAPPAALPAATTDVVAVQRAALTLALVQAGVEPGHAQGRLAALTDAEITALSARFDHAPAGGFWFAPFLVVAMVIGALIGARSHSADASDTDLFGRPRKLATAP